MSLLQVNPALGLAEPLIEQEREAIDKDCDRELEERHEKVELLSRIKFVLLGAVTGFFIQIVSLGAYAFILVQYNGMSLRDSSVLSLDGFFQHRVDTATAAATTTATSEQGELFGGNAAVYVILSGLTQLDLMVYVLIWVGFTCTMTRNGMHCIRSQFFRSSSSDSTKSSDLRRYVFVLGVSFLVGIVVGAFAAWTAIDFYLDFPIPLQPILATVVVDLALCYMMVVCFDMGKSGKSDDEEEEDGDENDENEDEADLCC